MESSEMILNWKIDAEELMLEINVQASLAIRGGYVSEKFGSANTKTAILGLH